MIQLRDDNLNRHRDIKYIVNGQRREVNWINIRRGSKAISHTDGRLITRRGKT